MENLITKLQEEVGLTSEQAQNAVECMKKYMLENDMVPDWDDFFRAKAQKMTDKAKETYAHVSEKVSENSKEWTEKINDFTEKSSTAIDELSDKAAEKIKDLRNKAADFIADKD